MENKYVNSNIEIREIENGYQLEILVNNYKDSNPLNGKNGKFIESIPKGVWERAIESNKNNIELYVDHSPYVNVAESMKIEAREDGVYALATLTNKARNLYEAIKEQGCNGISFGFECLKDKWNGIRRTINEMNLFEVSILMTQKPAYNGGYAEVRNIEVPSNNIDLYKLKLRYLKLL